MNTKKIIFVCWLLPEVSDWPKNVLPDSRGAAA